MEPLRTTIDYGGRGWVDHIGKFMRRRICPHIIALNISVSSNFLLQHFSTSPSQVQLVGRKALPSTLANWLTRGTGWWRWEWWRGFEWQISLWWWFIGHVCSANMVCSLLKLFSRMSYTLLGWNVRFCTWDTSLRNPRREPSCWRRECREVARWNIKAQTEVVWKCQWLAHRLM